MSFGRNYQPQGGVLHEYHWPANARNYDNYNLFQNNDCDNYNRYNHYGSHMINGRRGHDYQYGAPKNRRDRADRGDYSNNYGSPSFKRRKFSENAWGNDTGFYWQPKEGGIALPNPSNNNALVYVVAAPSTSGNCYTTTKRDRPAPEDDDYAALMSKEDMEKCSPSRKDGIDALHEARLRHSYCSYIQNLGMRLDLPQTTIGTAMVLCHRFFVRRSHACHDRFLIATAALFLAAKSEETARPLNDVLKASCEILYKQDLSILSYMLPIDLFEQYRERITEAEQLILTTLNFELNVQHPYDPLTSILDKLGLSQTVLVNLALSLVSEGYCLNLEVYAFAFVVLLGAMVPELTLAPVQAPPNCCWCSIPCCQNAEYESWLLLEHLARISGATHHSSGSSTTIDGAVLGLSACICKFCYMDVYLFSNHAFFSCSLRLCETKLASRVRSRA